MNGLALAGASLQLRSAAHFVEQAVRCDGRALLAVPEPLKSQKECRARRSGGPPWVVPRGGAKAWWPVKPTEMLGVEALMLDQRQLWWLELLRS